MKVQAYKILPFIAAHYSDISLWFQVVLNNFSFWNWKHCIAWNERSCRSQQKTNCWISCLLPFCSIFKANLSSLFKYWKRISTLNYVCDTLKAFSFIWKRKRQFNYVFTFKWHDSWSTSFENERLILHSVFISMRESCELSFITI